MFNLKTTIRDTGAIIIRLKNRVFKVPLSLNHAKENLMESSLIPQIRQDQHFNKYLPKFKNFFFINVTPLMIPLEKTPADLEKINGYFKDSFEGHKQWPRVKLRFLLREKMLIEFIKSHFPEYIQSTNYLLDSIQIPKSSAHGDFILENILYTHDRSLAFIDWSRYQQSSSLFFDLINFHIHLAKEPAVSWIEYWKNLPDELTLSDTKIYKDLLTAFALWKMSEELWILNLRKTERKQKNIKYLDFIKFLFSLDKTETSIISKRADLTVLCLSFRTPPAVRPQAILIGKMVPEWIRKGLKPIIVSYDDNGNWDINVPIHKIRPLRLGRIVNRLPLLREFLEYLHYRKICCSILPYIEQHQPDVIFSFANPQISNVIGAMLHNRTKIPYVAHFSDPWYDNPLEHKSAFQKLKTYLQERYVIKQSDRIILVNNVLRDLVMKKYPASWAEKTDIIPHCFDPADFPQEPKVQNIIFTLRYIGAFYQKRNPEPLLRAIADLLKQPGVRARGFRLELVGANLGYAGYSKDNLAAALKKFCLEDFVKVTPSVSYPESLKLMHSADCLVVIDADIPGSPFLPCKPIDYAGSRTPIVGITPVGSPTSWFLENLGYKSFDYTHLENFANYLAELISGHESPVPKVEFLKQYHVQQTSAKLIEVFKQIINPENKNKSSQI